VEASRVPPEHVELDDTVTVALQPTPVGAQVQPSAHPRLSFPEE
jgi:hypothetical protein